MNGHEMKVWASSVLTGMVLEVNRNIIKGVSWLYPAEDTKHITLTKLNTMIKGVNIVLQ